MGNLIEISTVENAALPSIVASARGTRIRIAIHEDGIDEVIDAGFDRLVVERSIDGGITFAEVTKAGDRPVLDKATKDYSFFDRSGDPSYSYRTRYIDTKKDELSDASEAISGEGLAIRRVLSVAELKQRYFFGVNINDDFGNALSEQTFEHYIIQAIRWMEHQIDVPILPTVVVDETHDYYRSDYNAYNFIHLDNYPVISVEEFSVQYPSGQNAVVFPPEWMRLNALEGQLQIVPTAGTLSEMLIGQGGSFLPAIGYGVVEYLPQLFHVSYTAGFGEGQVPRNIVDLIGMFASLGPFNIFGDLLGGAGIASFSQSLDGLSQSVSTTSSATNAGYGARVIQYLKQIKQDIPMLKRYYKGIRMAVA